MEYEEHPKITLTIEGQLETFTRSRNSTERHRCLWHAWNHNKGWLIQLLEWVMPSFPTYSKHDVSHAETVVHNIEMLMGENVIKNLSASDCFLILHVVYIHDIGMCITSEYRIELMKRPEFINFLKECSADPVLKEYADVLLMDCKEFLQDSSGSDRSKLETDFNSEYSLLQSKLKVYYAIMYLVSEYRRYDHGQESQKMLSEWVIDNNQLGAGFSTSGIPSRFFYTIAACAGVHTSYKFDDVMALPKQDGGYAHDYMHPRFAAVLLQLGDALDLDNDRFHPLMKKFNYNIPEVSKLHFGKHRAIRRLRINPKKITIHADCEHSGELRLVYREYEGIKSILREATFHWSAICPEDLEMVLPELENLDLMLKGQAISAELVKTEFRIQQPKAFNLLQGSNIYKTEKFVFLREVFQNAVDATKLEYWKEWKGSRWKKNDKTKCEQFLDPHAYPIEVEFHLGVKEKYKRSYFNLDSIDAWKEYQKKREEKNTETRIENPEFGVMVKVTDYGTGITQKDIREIANVGSRYNPDSSIYADMPEWLKPTAEFGLGLQSIFLITDYYKAYTHVRNGECYNIEFNGTGEKGDGSINVEPIDSTLETNQRAFGTSFEIFVSNKYKDQISIENQFNEDPFAQNISDDDVQMNCAREMIIRMVQYLDDIIGEKLFPVKIRVYDMDAKDTVAQVIANEVTGNLYIELVANDQIYPLGGIDKEEEVTWTYGNTDKSEIYKSIDECKYLFDFKNGCLKVADSDNRFYACFSPERLIKLRRRFHDPEMQQKYTKTRIYYKGVYVTEYALDMDLDMLEYIDIKGSLKREYLAMNRSEFTAAGEKYICEEVYPRILDFILKAINDFTFSKEWAKLEEWLKKNEEEKQNQAFALGKDEYQILRNYLFIIGIVAFTHSRTHNTYLLYTEDKKQDERNEKWNKILKLLSDYIENQVKKFQKVDNHWSHSIFYQMNVYETVGRQDIAGKIELALPKNLASILDTNNKYAIISMRKKPKGSWNEILVHLTGEYSQNIKENIMRLKIQQDPVEQKKLIDEIEKKLSKIAESAYIAEDNLFRLAQESYAREYEIIVWMLDNLPSLAIYSNSDNTIRINVLDCEQTDSVYMSRYLKLAICKKIIEKYRNDSRKQRFSTIASTTFCQLGLNKEHPGVHFLKKGKFGRVGRRQVLLPLSGETFVILQNWLDSCFLSKVFELYERIYQYCTWITKLSNKVMDTTLEFSEHPEWLNEQEENRINYIVESMNSYFTKNGEYAILDYPILCGEISSILEVRLTEQEKMLNEKNMQFSEKEKGLKEICQPFTGQNLIQKIQPLLDCMEPLNKENSVGRIEGIICEALLLSLNGKSCQNTEEQELYEKLETSLVFSWKLMKNCMSNLKEYICVGKSSWNYVYSELIKYFAYIDLPNERIDVEQKKQEAVRIKRKLIHYVKENNWVGVLDDNQIETMYSHLIRDIMGIYLIPLEERKKLLDRNFHIKTVLNTDV